MSVAPKERLLRLLVIVLLQLVATMQSRAQEAGGLGVAPAGTKTMSELLGQAQVAYDSREYKEADKLFTEFVGTYRDEPQAIPFISRMQPFRAMAKLRLKQFKAALPLIDEALKSKGKVSEIGDELAFWKGLCLMQIKDYRSAQVAFGEFYRDRKKRVDQQARCHESLLLFGACSAMMNEHTDAADFFAWQMPRLRRESGEVAARATVMLLYSLLESGQLDLALEFALEQFGSISDVTQIISFQSLTMKLGSRFLEEGNYYNAIMCLQRVWPRERLIENQEALLEELTGKLEILKARGHDELIFRYDGMHRRVVSELESFRQVKDFDAALRLRLADAFRQLGRYREAALIIERMIEGMKPGDLTAGATLTLIQCWMEILRWPKAVSAADRFIELFKEFPARLPEVLMLRSRALHNWGKHELALQGFRDLYHRFPEAGVAGQALFMQGIVLLKLDRNAEAIALFEDMRRELPDHHLIDDAFYWQGMGYSFQGEHEQAGIHLASYLDQFSQGRYRPDAVFRCAFSTFAIADYRLAIAQLRDYLKRYEGDIYNDEAFLLLGDGLLAVGEIDSGVASYKRIKPSAGRFFEEGYFNIGKALRLQARFTDMREHFSRFVDGYPGSPRMAEAVYWIGWAHKAEGNLEAALSIYRDVIRVHGERHELFGIADVLDGLLKLYSSDNRQGYAFEMQRLASEAQSKGEKTLELHARWAAARAEPVGSASYRLSYALAARLCDPEIHNPRILADCADYLFEKGEMETADELFKGLRKWNPRSMERDRVYLGRARIAIKRGESAKALEFLEKVKKETPYSRQCADADLLTAGILSSAGEYDEAFDVLAGILTDKTSASAAKAEALFRSAEILSEKGDKLKATAYYERVYVAYGKFRGIVAKSFLRRGQLMEELGRVPEAIEVYRALLQREDLADLPEYTQVRKHLAKIEEDAGV